MAKSMTKHLQFDRATAEEIMARDQRCFFCARGYHMDGAMQMDVQVQDIMHVVPRSHLGLGVKENGVLGCRYHHSLLDNGNKGLHSEMEGMLYEYMRELYPGWTPEGVTYSKWRSLVPPVK